MHTRKYTFGRNLLRFFEIALFFAVSVLGYGLLYKTGSQQSKSKSRSNTLDLQQQLAGKSTDPGLTPSEQLFAVSKAQRLFPDTNTGNPFHLHRLLSGAMPCRLTPSCCNTGKQRYHADHAPTPLPCNLLQENPVLLI